MINLEHIEVTFGSFKALKDINIDIHEGEFFTFLGPSGCGKTTTLRTITGFISPSGGTVSDRDCSHPWEGISSTLILPPALRPQPLPPQQVSSVLNSTSYPAAFGTPKR